MVVEGKVPTEHHQTGASETDLTAVADVICDEITADESNAPARIRTLDPLIKSQLLYQLSYRGLCVIDTHH